MSAVARAVLVVVLLLSLPTALHGQRFARLSSTLTSSDSVLTTAIPLDVTRDGSLDVLSFASNVRYFENSGDGNLFRAEKTFGPGFLTPVTRLRASFLDLSDKTFLGVGTTDGFRLFRSERDTPIWTELPTISTMAIPSFVVDDFVFSDMNSDGLPDVLMVGRHISQWSSPPSLLCFLQNAHAPTTFTGVKPVSIPGTPSNVDPVRVFTADLRSRGMDDVLVMFDDASIAYAFRSNASEPVFGAATLLRGPQNNANVLIMNDSPLAFGDVDGDGHLDVVFYDSEKIQLAKGQAAYPYLVLSGTIHALDTSTAMSWYVNIVLAPLVPGQQEPDLLVSRNNEWIKFFKNLGGNGLFNLEQTFTPSDHVRGLGVGDFNGNGALDFLSVEGPAVFIHQQRYVSSWASITTSLLQSVTAPMRIAASQSDLVVAETNNKLLRWLRPLIIPGLPHGVTPLAFEPTTIIECGDGFAVASDQGHLVLVRNYGVVRVLANGTLPTGATPKLACGDMDGDGDVDVVSQVGQKIFVNGTTLVVDVEAAAFGIVSDFALGDFDLDGRLDVVVALQLEGTESVRLWYGGDVGGPLNVRVDAQVGDSAPTLAIHVDDLDVDGLPDVLIVSQRRNTISIVYGRRNGQFDSPVLLFDAARGAPKLLAVSDTTLRGALDVMLFNAGTREVIFLGVDPNTGRFETPDPIESVGKGANKFVDGVLFDMNDDGRLDLVLLACSASLCDVDMLQSKRDVLPPSVVAVSPTPASPVRSPCLTTAGAPCFSLELALAAFRFSPGGLLRIDIAAGTHMVNDFVSLDAYRGRRLVLNVAQEGATIMCSSATFLSEPCVRIRTRAATWMKNAIVFTGGQLTIDGGGSGPSRHTPLLGLEDAVGLLLGAHALSGSAGWLVIRRARVFGGNSKWGGASLAVVASQSIGFLKFEAEDAECSSYGAHVFVEDSTDIWLYNFRLSDVRGSILPSSGGGAFLRKSVNVVMQEGSFARLSTSDHGGGLAIVECSGVQLLHVAFEDCTAVNEGGAISDRLSTTTLVLKNIVIRNCTVTTDASGRGGSGGAVSIRSGSVLLQHTDIGRKHLMSAFPFAPGTCVVSGCSATFGGGFSTSSGSLIMWGDACLLEGNTAAVDGGAVFVEGGSLQVAGRVVFANNRARAGGAVSLQFSSASIARAVARDNWASDGGVVDCISSDKSTDKSVDLQYVTIERNRALGGDGGAVRSTGCNVMLTDSVVAGNTAARHGGAVFAQVSAQHLVAVTLGTTIANNSALGGNGGGLHVVAPAGFSFLDFGGDPCSFVGNTAPQGGGGAFYWRATAGAAIYLPSTAVLDGNRARYGDNLASPPRNVTLDAPAPRLPAHASRATVDGVALVARVRDVYGQVVATDQQTSVRVSSSGQLIGTTSVIVRDGVGNFTGAFAVEAPPNSTASLTFSADGLASAHASLPVLPCTAGEFEEDGLRCRACRAGTFSRGGPGGSACSACDKGLFQRLGGQSLCETCRPGEFSPASPTFGVETCTACAPGTFANASSMSACLRCAPGTFMPLLTANQSACLECDAGTVSPSPGQIGCLACNPGLSAPLCGMSTCTPCVAGRFSAARAVNCTLCAPGYFAPFNNSAQCLRCPAGRFAGAGGASECEACPIGTFASEEGATTCTPCPSFSRQPERGKAACEFCGDETYMVGDECVPCPSGAVCLRGRAPFAKSGFYLTESPNSHAIESFACTGGRCVECEGSTDEVQCCSAHREPAASNVLCGACVHDYYEWGGNCVYCDSTNGVAVFLLLVALWLYVLVVHVLSQQTGGSAAIAFYFLQICSLSVGSDASVGSFFVFVDLNVFEAAGGQCVAPLGALQKIILRLFVPAFCLGFLLLTMLLHAGAVVWRARKSLTGLSSSSSSFNLMAQRAAEEHLSLRDVLSLLRDSYFRSLLSLLLFSYNSTTTTTITSLDCTSVLDATVVRSEPSVSCTSDAYHTAMVLFVILLVVFVVLFPAGLLWWLWRRNRALGFSSAVTAQVRRVTIEEQSMFSAEKPADEEKKEGEEKQVDPYGVLYEPFRDERYYWQVVILLRRAVLIFATLIFAERRELKFTVLTTLHLISLHAHLLLRPYRQAHDNHWEAVFLTLLAAISVLLLPTDSSARLSSSRAAALGILVYLPTALFVVSAIVRKGWGIAAAFSMKQEKQQEKKERVPSILEAREATMEVEMMGEPLQPPPPSSSSWERFETDDGIPYWYCNETGESRWDAPK